MSTAGAALAIARPPDAASVLPPGWARWLAGQIDPCWRPREWQPKWWLFTGSPDEPRTSVSLCRTAACEVLVSPNHSFCPTCNEERKRSGLARDDFAASFVPQHTRVSWGRPGPVCRVNRRGQRCARPAVCKALCTGHYHQQRHYAAKGQAGFFEEHAVPYLSADPCPVPGCPVSALHQGGLCRYHEGRFREFRRTTPDADLAAWAAVQPPYLAPHQFSLVPLPEPLRLEALFGLQQAEQWMRLFEPCVVRRLVRDLAGSGADTLMGPVGEQVRARTLPVQRLLERVRTAVRAAFDECNGTGPGEGETLDLRALGQVWRGPAGIRRPKTVDLRIITQPWLRQLLHTWTVQERPRSEPFALTLRACELASAALATRPGTNNPTRLRYEDVTACVDAFRTAPRLDGARASASYRMMLAGHFFALLDWGRRAEAAPGLSAAFVRDASRHRIPRDGTDQDDIGKALPEPVIRQLDAHLGSLGQGVARGQRTLAVPDLQLMYRTLYIVLRDTGRRPLEVVSLPRDCLETQSDQASLIWHNHKSHRMRRRLPITTGTAAAIRAWQHRRTELGHGLPPAGQAHLFPALTHLATAPHIPSAYLGETMRAWVDALPALHGEGIDTDGNPLPFDRSLVYPYAFRHSYAQRHADAGTPVDVLCELMDHREVRTTQRYYTVSQQRKREAVAKLSAYVLDIHGHPSPCTTSAYELRSVAVPYGGCTEPSNVKAGGRACPIRFQCAGCGFYRPDPSYLPAIEQHLNELRADREAALAMDAQEFVISALTAQITAFENVTATMCRRLDALTPDERAQIEHASTVLRKARAGTLHALLPVISPNPESRG
jgi:integrase